MGFKFRGVEFEAFGGRGAGRRVGFTLWAKGQGLEAYLRFRV